MSWKNSHIKADVLLLYGILFALLVYYFMGLVSYDIANRSSVGYILEVLKFIIRLFAVFVDNTEIEIRVAKSSGFFFQPGEYCHICN